MASAANQKGTTGKGGGSKAGTAIVANRSNLRSTLPALSFESLSSIAPFAASSGKTVVDGTPDHCPNCRHHV